MPTTSMHATRPIRLNGTARSDRAHSWRGREAHYGVVKHLSLSFLTYEDTENLL
jgi:hypothetical protein